MPLRDVGAVRYKRSMQDKSYEREHRGRRTIPHGVGRGAVVVSAATYKRLADAACKRGVTVGALLDEILSASLPAVT